MIIGITEAGDAGLDWSWQPRLYSGSIDGAVLITKAPHMLPEMPGNVVIHATITGLGATYVEPGVAPLEITIPAYKELVRRYGGDRVVLRVDPIIPTTTGIQLAMNVIEQAESRVRISILDAYPHIIPRLSSKGAESVAKIYKGQLHAPLDLRKIILAEAVKRTHRIEVCGEPGLPCSGCISVVDLSAMGIAVPDGNLGRANQRPACLCIAAKTELLKKKKQCRHACLYCYWR